TECPAMCVRRCFIRAVFLCCTARAATRCFPGWNRKPAKSSGRPISRVARSSAVHPPGRMAKSTCRTTPARCTWSMPGAAGFFTGPRWGSPATTRPAQASLWRTAACSSAPTAACSALARA
ncbi:uncharacterized protein METZ01_LOCUS405751, partial [marine metagenome]